MRGPLINTVGLMRLTRVLRVVPLALLAVPVLLLGAAASPAQAEPGDVIRSFDSTITINAQGSLHVREQIAYTFGGSDRHGIYRSIPVLFDIEDDPDHQRVATISNIKVSSPT